MSRTIIIGSRGSDLALWQAHHVQNQLQNLGVTAEIKIIKTQGDTIQHLSFDKMEGKGFFTKEIETALLQNQIDIAVHSHKDLETTNPEGLTIAAVSDREEPNDLLLIRKSCADKSKSLYLKNKALVGTSSARRKAQLLGLRNDIEIKDIRGNVPTRIHKLREGQFDAILLAKAGVKRLQLNISDLEVVDLNPQHFIPAPAQGVLGIQCRDADTEIKSLLNKLNKPETKHAIDIERGILRKLNGGCQMPMGGYTTKSENGLLVRASVANSWNSFPKRVVLSTSKDKVEESIEQVIAELRNTSSKSVFISREKEECSVFHQYFECNNGTVTAKSLIEFNVVSIHELPKADWIFFSSKRSIAYTLIQIEKEALHSYKIGCIGEATAHFLRSYDLSADFIGDTTIIADVASAFEQKMDNGTVVFPQSSKSLRSVQKGLENNEKIEVIDLTVYETSALKQVEIQDHDAYVFTSPSNVDAFLTHNSIPPQARTVAIGKATLNQLHRAGVSNAVPSFGFHELDLVDSVIHQQL